MLMSYFEIGNWFGGRDYFIVISVVCKIEKLCVDDFVIRSVVGIIEGYL